VTPADRHDVDRRVAPLRPTGTVELESEDALAAHLDAHGSLAGCVLKGLELEAERWVDALATVDLAGAAFLGCHLARSTLDQAQADGALVFPPISGLPFDPYRGDVYTPAELYDAFASGPASAPQYADCLDAQVDSWFLANRPPDVLAALFQRLHDHAITDALAERVTGRDVVAVMGGHDARRGDPAFAAAASLGRDLARRGLLVATGGGPGAMEAVNLGAFLSGAPDDELRAALMTLAAAPDYADRDAWVGAAWSVRRAAADAGVVPVESVGVPTWFYGHEPPNAFAECCAKYFENSVREDGLLALGTAGVIFTPGSAGTVQEVFQDATANHYATTGAPRPMVFLGVEAWTQALPVVPLLRRLAEGHAYADRILVTDDAAAAVQFVVDWLPSTAGGAGP
jgi:predicted Rossmann-fold nucleotide-binding protein